jgi:NitT/TauT family transport system permease protein
MSRVHEAADRYPTLEADLEKVRQSRRGGSLTAALVYPGLAVLAALGAWYGAIVLLAIPPYVLPLPQDVLGELVAAPGLFARHAGITLYAAVGGFVLSVVVGVPIAIAIVWSEPFGKAIMPILIFSQTMPKVAIAPLFILWFGFGLLPKIVIAFLISFFPVVISMATGLLAVETEMLELIRSMAASKRQVFVKARIPTALPFLFSGLKVSITLCVIGAIVGEFVGANQGLGYLVLWANGQTQTALLFAVLIVLAVMGYVLYSVVLYLERLAIPWHTAVKAHQDAKEFSY